MKLEIFNHAQTQTEVEVLTFKEEIFFKGSDIAKVLDIKRIKESIDVTDRDYALKVTNKMLEAENSIGDNSTNSETVGFEDNNLVGDITTNQKNNDFRTLHITGETFLTEGGFYKAVFASRKPLAKLIQKWVLTEVLPQIRKTGSYGNPTLRDTQIDLVNQALPKRGQTFSTNTAIAITREDRLHQNIHILEEAYNDDNKQIVPARVVDRRMRELNNKIRTAEKRLLRYPDSLLNKQLADEARKDKSDYILANGLNPELHRMKPTTLTCKEKLELAYDKIAQLEAQITNLKRG